MSVYSRSRQSLLILAAIVACALSATSSQSHEPDATPADQPSSQNDTVDKPAEEPSADNPPADESSNEEASKPGKSNPEESGESSDENEEVAEDEAAPDKTPKQSGSEQESPPVKPSDDKPEPKTEPADKPLPDEVIFTDYLTVPLVGVYGRAAMHIDPVDAAFASGTFSMPKVGDEITAADERTVKWRSASAGKGGVLSTRSVRGGYAATQFESPAAGVMLLEATGHAAVYVNGYPHAGDPYAFGDFVLPVQIRKGTNTLVFHVAQGELKAKLTKPNDSVQLADKRITMPTLVRGAGDKKLWAAIAITNTQDKPVADATIVAKVSGGDLTTTPVAWLDAASLRNCGFMLAVPKNLDEDVAELQVQLVHGDDVLAEQVYELEVADLSAMQTRTFRSENDGSIQSYVVLPASGEQSDSNEAPGAIVALHSGGMSSRDFAAQYKPKSWAHIIVPGGRGLYPLDWQDWSSSNAENALADAREQFDINPQRICVTGHGMGGHGAFVLAANNPGTFAAAGTAAAWPSLWTYGGGMPSYREPSSVQAMLRRTASPSDTLAQLTNLQGTGVYLLHGTDDEEIPVDQSRQIAQNLADWHTDFTYRQKTGVGNWWGAETVDSPAMMQFLSERTLSPEVPDRVSLATSDLGTLSSRAWATIAAQESQFAMSRIDFERKKTPLSITGTTQNVKRIAIDKTAVPAKQPFVVRLDGSRPVVFSRMPASGRVWLEKVRGRWRRRLAPDKSDKSPQRYGGLKAVFDHNVLLVYGTIGSEEENGWSRAKAHFDAATFAYRAGGAIEVLADTEFNVNQSKDRNVVVYGNVDSNRAWAALMSTSPVQVHRGRMTIDTRPESGNDLGFLMVRPRTNSDKLLVAAVGGTGVKGMRLTNRLRYFWAGVAYPDLMLLGPEALTSGDGGIRANGYFAEDWDLDGADIAWRDLAL